MKRSKFLALLLLAGLTVASCKKEEKKEKEVTEEPMETVDETSMTTNVEPNVFTLEANDQMKFNFTELKAHVGKPIKITLKHVGKNTKDVMGHNLIILKPGTDMAAFSQKAIGAKETDYIPASEKGSIIAHTKLLSGGEEDTIEFTINEKGTYDFMCSFPAHNGLMKGKLIVE